MGYAVLHMEKTSGTDVAMSAHIERTIKPKNADENRTHLNRELIRFPNEVNNRIQAIQHRLDTAGLTRKIGNNQVRAIRVLLTGTHENMKRITNEGRLDEWCSDNLRYLADTFGRENIVSAVLHMDEQTPHIHATLVPIVKGERKRKKKEEQVKKRYRKKPTDTARLCADEIMTRAKKEVQTEKPKGAATTAATNIAESVGSLFGSNKVKTLERENAALHQVVATHEETIETLQSQIQTIQADHSRQVLAMQQKHIKELQVKEIEHKKEVAGLTILLNKAVRWFPQIKGMLNLERVCLAVGFSQEQTAVLMMGKPLEYSGELYSEEHKRKFMAKEVIAKVFSDNGKFILTIDLQPIGAWFKEQFEKLKQGLNVRQSQFKL